MSKIIYATSLRHAQSNPKYGFYLNHGWTIIADPVNYFLCDDPFMPLPNDSLIPHAPLSQADLVKAAKKMATNSEVARAVDKMLNPPAPDPDIDAAFAFFGIEPNPELDDWVEKRDVARLVFVHSDYYYTKAECRAIAELLLDRA